MRRLVRSARAGEDVARPGVSDLLDASAIDELTMPFGYGRSDLGLMLVTPTSSPRMTPEFVRRREQVLAAWQTRLEIDPADHARLGARIDELWRGMPATVDSAHGIAELRTLLHVANDASLVPPGLGMRTIDDLDTALRHGVAFRLEGDGVIPPAGHALIGRLHRAGDPARRASTLAGIDAAATGRGSLPSGVDLEYLLSDAAGWGSRGRAQRMRLLDLIAGRDEHGVPGLARNAASRQIGAVYETHPDLRSHVSRQVARAIAGEAPLPRGIHTRDILESWHYRRASTAEQHALLQQHSRSSSRPVFEEYDGLRDQLDDVARSVGRGEANAVLVDHVRRGAAMPAWITPGDIIGSWLPDPARLLLLRTWRSAAREGTPTHAAAQLVESRIRLGAIDAAQLDGAGRQLRGETMRLIDDNLARMTGALEDGYGMHPDYAGVGRVRANVDVLAGLVGGVAGPAKRATPGGATLSW